MYHHNLFHHIFLYSHYAFSGRVRFLGLYLLFVFVFSGFYGCRSSKDIVRKPSENDVKCLEQLMFSNENFGTLNSKVEFKFIPQDGISIGMRGAVKIRRDSCIILSVQPFAGIEAVRCLIRKDSIFIVSRLHQTYAVEDLSHLQNIGYLNLELLQAILSNKVFVLGVSSPTQKELNKFEWHKVKEGNYFRWPNEDYLLDFYLNDDGQYSELRASNPEKQEKVKVQYNLFKEEGTIMFPHQVIVSTEGFKKTSKFQITYLKPGFNTSTSFNFEIPSKYKKVTTEELIKRFQTML
jgi:hypothetical protein